MTEKLSRRLFLKATAALAASGVLAWKSDKLPAAEAEELPSLRLSGRWLSGRLENIRKHTAAMAPVEEPFYPYFIGGKIPEPIRMMEQAPFIPYYLEDRLPHHWELMESLNIDD